MIRPIDPEVLERKYNLVVSSIDKGISAAAIGRDLNLSRERICQIYYKKTGKSVRQTQYEQNIKMLESRPIIRKFCIECGVELTSRRIKYCSPDCYRKFISNRRDTITLTCAYCKKQFHPYKTRRYMMMKNDFCKAEHYHLWQEKDPNSYVNISKRRNKEVIKKLKENMPVDEIKKLFNLTSSAFYGIINKNGISILQMRAEGKYRPHSRLK